jgi:CheY-like chemotaxis protein
VNIPPTTSHILTAADYECLTVTSGNEALALLKAGERFDLMLCDLLNIPHGITLLERTKDKAPHNASSHSHGSVLLVYGTIRRQRHGCQ